MQRGTKASVHDDTERRYVRRRDTDDGMVRIEAVLHPDEAAVVWAALDRLSKQGCNERLRAAASDVTDLRVASGRAPATGDDRVDCSDGKHRAEGHGGRDRTDGHDDTHDAADDIREDERAVARTRVYTGA